MESCQNCGWKKNKLVGVVNQGTGTAMEVCVGCAEQLCGEAGDWRTQEAVEEENREVIERLEEIKEEMVRLIDETKELVRPFEMTYERARRYWLAHLLGCLTTDSEYGRLDMYTLEDAIREIAGRVPQEG